MRIALIGGVFDGAMGAAALSAPENVLLRFLQEEGHEVVAASVGRRLPTGLSADVFHAHHFGVGAYDLVLSGRRPAVFTSHNPFLVSDFDPNPSRLDAREADILARRYDVPRERFVVIPNGLDLSLYGPGQRSDREPGRIELLTVGQLVDYKGHRYVLEALGRLALRHPGLRLTMVTHQPLLRPQLEELCGRLGIADRVTFAGPFPTAELVERYRACDILVQPSLAECFPVTVLEAMACGKPVIATDVGGVAEQVGGAGIVVPPRDTAALETAIERLALSPEERARLGGLALERVRELYDGRSIARRHAELYAELAAARLRRRVLASPATSAAVLSAYERRASFARFVPSRLRHREVMPVN
jgi:glycosyltransferase involved in cell wall biosynthesis